MPPHLHYIEPFFGGGAVLLARDPERDWMAKDGERLPSHLKGCSEVVNDQHGELTNFCRVLQDPADFAKFLRKVECTPLSSVEWKKASESRDSLDRVERAATFFVFARQSGQGLMNDFATLSRNRTRRRMNEQVSAYLTAVEG